MRDQVEVEMMMGQFSTVIVGLDPEAQGVQAALRWVLFPDVPDEALTRIIPG
jgi:hypothetical protein